MSFHVQSGVSFNSNPHVSVDKPEFQITLADLRFRAYKEEKDNSMKSKLLVKELTEEIQELKQENMELRKENEKLEAKIKRMSKQV